MSWLSRGDRLRLDDHISASRDRDREQSEQHRELRDAVKNLSDQTRGEFERVRGDIERRHAENRKSLLSVFLVLLGAIATAYFASHGFATPGVDPGRPDFQVLDRKMDQLLQRKP